MTNKKPSTKKDVVSDLESIDETPVLEIETFDISSIPAGIRDRIIVLIRRRNQFGDLFEIIKDKLNGAPIPSDADGWAAFANSLER